MSGSSISAWCVRAAGSVQAMAVTVSTLDARTETQDSKYYSHYSRVI